jgi:hypothetical protein
MDATDNAGSVELRVSTADVLADDATVSPKTVHLEPVPIDESLRFIDVERLEAKVQQVLALTSFGFSTDTIAKAWGSSRREIANIVKKYDPDRKFQLSKSAKRAFLTKMLESRAGEALAYLTPDKLKAAKAVDLATIAEKMLCSIAKMEPRDTHKVLVGSIDDVMKRLSQKPIELEEVKDGVFERPSESTERVGQTEGVSAL